MHEITEINTIDQAIMEEKYSPMDIYDLWDELDQIILHFNVAFEKEDNDISKEYFQEMHYIKDMIKASPLQEKQDLLAFFRRHNKMCTTHNDFEGAAYFKGAEARFMDEYM